MVNDLIELLGYALIAVFAWFVWPPLTLLVAGLLLVLLANVRAVRGRSRPLKRAVPKPVMRNVA